MNLRKLAQGKPCMVRIPGVCNHNPETTVLAHLNGGGMGMKQPDLIAAWCCSACHDFVDGRAYTRYQSSPNREYLLMEGIIRTQQELLKMGLSEAIEDWK